MKTLLFAACAVIGLGVGLVLLTPRPAHAGFLMGYMVGSASCDDKQDVIAQALADAVKACDKDKDRNACIIAHLHEDTLP